MTVNFNIQLSQSQQEVYDLVHNDKYKYITVVFSRQSGKSTLMKVLCIEWLLQSNNTIAYVCKDFELARQFYRELIRIIPKELIKTKNGSDLYIESVYGSTLSFHSALQGSSLRGKTFTHCINDEFSFFKMEQSDGTHLWNDILSPTLKARGKKCLFVGTPLGRNNPLFTMYERGLLDEFDDYASILKTIYDDGFVTPDEIERIKRDIPPLSFQQEYECRWLEDGNTFFQGYSDCFNINEYSEGRKCWAAIDISVDGSDSTIFTLINDINEVKSIEITGSLDNKYYTISNLINNTPNLVACFMENNGVGAPFIDQVKKQVKQRSKIYEWNTTNSSKEEIVSELAVAIANREIHFEKEDTKLYNELGDFVVTVSKTRKLTFAARGNKHDDRVLSLSMALRCKNEFKYSGTNNIKFIQQKDIWLR